jgi:hypothetical protein
MDEPFYARATHPPLLLGDTTMVDRARVTVAAQSRSDVRMIPHQRQCIPLRLLSEAGRLEHDADATSIR